MTDDCWLPLSGRERAIVLDALSAYGASTRSKTRAVNALSKRLREAKPYPEITIGVSGGVVQWTLGNPFPIRICDYDGDDERDWPDVDERGQPCTIAFELPDTSLQPRSS
jgi:hypothetical protein